MGSQTAVEVVQHVLRSCIHQKSQREIVSFSGNFHFYF